MSVLIKGMKMPPVGRVLMVFPSGRVLEVSSDKIQDVYGDAEAVELPPHGDLIDRDAFMKKDVPFNGHWDENAGRFHCYPPTYMQAVDDIRVAPTIIEAEEGE